MLRKLPLLIGAGAFLSISLWGVAMFGAAASVERSINTGFDTAAVIRFP